MNLIIWLIVSLVLIFVWEGLTHIIPEGWVLAPINILFFLATFAIGAFGYLPALRKRMNGLLAWLLSLILWFIVFILIRSLLFPAK